LAFYFFDSRMSKLLNIIKLTKWFWPADEGSAGQADGFLSTEVG
jgi:hypothetical protein